MEQALGQEYVGRKKIRETARSSAPAKIQILVQTKENQENLTEAAHAADVNTSIFEHSNTCVEKAKPFVRGEIVRERHLNTKRAARHICKRARERVHK